MCWLVINRYETIFCVCALPGDRSRRGQCKIQRMLDPNQNTNIEIIKPCLSFLLGGFDHSPQLFVPLRFFFFFYRISSFPSLGDFVICIFKSHPLIIIPPPPSTPLTNSTTSNPNLRLVFSSIFPASPTLTTIAAQSLLMSTPPHLWTSSLPARVT